MKFDWRDKKWRSRALWLLSAIVLLSFAAHPELRLMLPLVDAVGLDVLFLLLSAQLLDYARPMAGWLAQAMQPVLRSGFLFSVFMLGIAGPYLGGALARRFARPPVRD